MDKKQTTNLVRTILVAVSVLSVLTVWQIWRDAQMFGIIIFSSQWPIVLLGIGGGGVFGLIALLLSWNVGVRQRVERISFSNSVVVKIIAFFLFMLLVSFFSWFYVFSPWSSIPFVHISYLKWWVFFVLGVSSALALKAGWKCLPLGTAFLAGFTGEAFVSRMANLLTRVSTSPFVLTWEENYRFYYASLLASEKLYGYTLPLSPVDFSLNILNGIPFLVGDLPIWVHRIWQVLLTIGLSVLTGWALIRRLKLEKRLWRWLLIGLLVLYFLQEGGVKYNLLICVLVVLLGFSGHHPWRSLVSIIAASFWAGLSRVNWIPIPAMLGITLYLLEEKIDNYSKISHYLLKPAILAAIGLITAFGSNSLVGGLPGASHSTMSSMLSSDFLLYRLFPNATYSTGILIPVMFLSFPQVWIFLEARCLLRPIRMIGLAAMLMLLLVGGLFVSIKIGGGSDLHNLDAYLSMQVIVTTYIFFRRCTPDTTAEIVSTPWFLLALTLVIPFWSACKDVRPYLTYDHEAVNTALQVLKDQSERASGDGEVLFMYQKQLLAFGYIDVPLVPEYENVFLLDMAMSETEVYLDKFYNDLCQHRFSLIVSEYQPQGLQGSTHGFGEENDAWYNAITQPLLQTYQLDSRIPEAGIELYFPQQEVDCGSLP